MTDPASPGIQVIARAAAILREVAAFPDGRSLGQLAVATGLARSTVQRIVNALAAECLVQAGPGGVRPGWGLRQLADDALPAAARRIRLPLLRPHLLRLFEDTGCSVDLSTLWDGDVQFLDRVLATSAPRGAGLSDARYAAHAMANGKALLACLPDDAVRALHAGDLLAGAGAHAIGNVEALIAQLDAIRAGGFAYDREEREPGWCAIGKPLDLDGPVPLAVSVVVTADRFDVERPGIEIALDRRIDAMRQALALSVDAG